MPTESLLLLLFSGMNSCISLPDYQPPPDYSTLEFQEIPKLGVQQTFPSPDHAPSVDRPLDARQLFSSA
jgi:hypothetical protein